MREPSGRLGGFLIGLVDLEGSELRMVLERAAWLGRSGHALLVDSQGRVVASNVPIPFMSPGEHPRFYQQAMASGRPQVAVVPVESEFPGESPGHLHVMALAPLRSAPWAIAIGGDVTILLAPIDRLRWRLVLLSLTALLAIWGGSLLGTRLLVRPVHRLTEAAQRIADGDLGTPLQVWEGGEIGAMAAALERMRVRLLENIQELARWGEILEEQVAERTEALRQQEALTRQLVRRLLTAQEEERARLARELHDEAGQILTAVQLRLDRLSRSLGEVDPALQEQIQRTRELIGQAMEDLRRMITALRPGILDQLGLAPALGWMADALLRPLGIQVHLDVEGLDERLPGEVELVLFRIAQEAMNNIARHSGATRVWIRLAGRESGLIMEIQDDGRGFDPSQISAPPYGRGLGLAGMRERASLIGGRLEIESAPGSGMRIQAYIPRDRLRPSAAASPEGELPPPPVEHGDGRAVDSRADCG